MEKYKEDLVSMIQDNQEVSDTEIQQGEKEVAATLLGLESDALENIDPETAQKLIAQKAKELNEKTYKERLSNLSKEELSLYIAGISKKKNKLEERINCMILAGMSPEKIKEDLKREKGFKLEEASQILKDMKINE